MYGYGRDELGTKPGVTRRRARGPRALRAFCACVLGVLLALPVHADDVGVSVLPPSVEVNLAPEGMVSRELAVGNFAQHAVRVAVSTGEYRGESTGEAPGLSAAEWVQVRPAQFLLDGYGETTVSVDIQVPADVQSSGGRYAALVFDVQSVDPLQDFGATNARTDVPIIVTVEATGPLSRRADVEWFVPVLEPDGRVSFRARLVNTGNVLLVAGGEVQVSGPGGQITPAPVFPETGTLLPGEGVVLATEPALPLTLGQSYAAQGTVSYGGDDPIEIGAAFVATAALSVTDLGAVSATGRPPRFVVTLVNEGELALRPRAQVYVRSADLAARGTTFDSGPSLLMPGGTGEMLFGFEGHLPPGDHILEATVYYGTGGRIEVEKGFSVGGDGATGGPDAADGTGWYLPVGVSLGALALLAILVGLWLRKRAGSARGS